MDGDDAAVAGDCVAEVCRAVPAIATAAKPAADGGTPPLPTLAVDSWRADGRKEGEGGGENKHAQLQCQAVVP